MDPARPSVLALPLQAARRSVRHVWELQQRERERLRIEIGHTRDLMPLLMKQRNGTPWTAEERRALRRHLRQLAGLSPYLVLLVAPGGLLALPALAWWLDRRRLRRPDAG